MIHVTDFSGNIVDFVSKNDDSVVKAEHTINVESKMETFDFTILTNRTEHMQKRNRIIIEDKDGQYREFIIYDIQSDLDGYTEVQCNAAYLEDIKTAKPVAPHKLERHTVKQALQYALADTGWEVADNAEWGGERTTSWTGWHDRLSILKQLETTYGMRLSFFVEVGTNKINKRFVRLSKFEALFQGEEIVYGDNMLDLKRTVDFSDIATALMCLGPEDYETGKREIVELKDDDAQAQFGLPYRYIWDIYEPESSDESMTRERLTTLGRTALNKRKQASVTYDISATDLNASVGDLIRVKNEDFTPELYVDAEVTEIKTDLIDNSSDYKFGVIKEYTRDDIYARFNAMLGELRERLSQVVSNTGNIISERLEEELKYVERYIEKSPVPPLNPKEGQLWLDTSHGTVPVLKRYENGRWIKSSVSDVKEIGGMTREETIYETLKERKSRIEVDYSDVFNQYDTLTKDRYYHYVESDYRLDLENKFGVMKSAYDVFIGAFNNINSEQPTIGLLTTAISRAIDFEIALRNFRISYNVARKDFDAYMRILQSQYTEEKFNEAMEKVADSIGGTFDGTNIIADIPNQEDLNQLNKDIKDYLTGQIDTLDDKLGKKVVSDIKTARDELSASIGSVEKKVQGLESANNEITQTVTKHDTSIGLLENEIRLKVTSTDVTQQLDNALKPLQSTVNANKAELQVQAGLINGKVSSTQYTADMNNVTRELQTATSERKQLAESIKQTVSVDEYSKDSKNLLKDSVRYIKNGTYNIARYDLAEDLKEGEIVTIQLKGRLGGNKQRFGIYNSGGLISPTSLYPSDIKGKRNLAINTEIRDDYVSHNGDFARVQYDLAEKTVPGKTYTVSFDIVGSLTETDAVTVNNFIPDGNISQSFYCDLDGTHGVVTFTATQPGEKILIYKGKAGRTSENYDRTIYIKNVMIVEGTKEAPWSLSWEEDAPIFEKTFEWSNSRIYNGVTKAPVGQWLNIYQMNSADTGESEIYWVKLERGSIATPYSKSPQDTEEVLTRYNTEINQAKDSINQRVSYEQFNKSNKTLERLITSLNQTSTGLEFIIDTNGIIQGFNLNKDKFRFDSKMIEFNDGDVVIKDGKTSITQAFIDSLFANSAFIHNLKAVDIDLNRATVHGGDSVNYIKLDHQSIMSYGKFTRSWGGETDTANLELGLYDGQIRMRNLDTGYRLYLTERGLSTSMAGAIDQYTSGTLEFHSQRFNANSRGVTLHSSYGAVAMVSDYSTAVIRSSLTANLESDNYSVYIRPYRVSISGHNEFRFWVKEGADASETDGVLSYGNTNVRQASGLRFKKSTTGEPTVWITNGNGDYRSGSASMNILYANTMEVSRFDMQHSYAFSNYGGGDVYMGTGGGEFRITNNNHWRDGNPVYRPIRASAFNPGSYYKYKKEITEWNYDVLSVIKDEFQAYQYKLRDDIDKKLRHGVVVGGEYQTVIEFINNDGVDLYEMTTWALRGVQQLAHENDTLKSEIAELKSQINKIMEMIA